MADWTRIPVQKLEEEESERLSKLEEILHQRVVGQEEAVTAVSRAIRRGRVGLKDPKRTNRLLSVFRSDRCGKNRTLQSSGRGDVWHRTGIDPCGYVRIYGKT